MIISFRFDRFDSRILLQYSAEAPWAILAHRKPTRYYDQCIESHTTDVNKEMLLKQTENIFFSFFLFGGLT